MGVPAETTAQAERDLYLPQMATIVEARDLTEHDRWFRLELPESRPLGHCPGQFVQVSLFGFGEAPISICSSHHSGTGFELCVRNIGSLTKAMHKLGAGDQVGIRGPFGNGFPTEKMEGRDCLLVAGGIGMAPLRSLVQALLAERSKYGKLTLLYGSRTPSDVLFPEDLEKWRGEDSKVLLTVDHADDSWKGNVGVVTTLFPQLEVSSPENMLAALCGPPVMYRFVYAELRSLGLSSEQMFFSLERRMKCGIGKCGHCQIGPKYVCVDGPVFSGVEIDELRESI